MTLLEFLKLGLNKQIRRTKHFQEWYKLPRNYVRIREFEWVEKNLTNDKSSLIVDFSSPKWLAFKLLYNGYSILPADSDEYFLEDFKIYDSFFDGKEKPQVINLLEIPYKDNHFDQAFSVSVLEHIPEQGDIRAMSEIMRVLKKGSSALITLPASTEFMEEYLKEKSFYWETKSTDEDYFYQRRYSYNSIIERLLPENSILDNFSFIAERPIKQPFKNENGMLFHNAYFLKEKPIYRLMEKLDSRYLPLTQYLLESYFSKKYQYWTKEKNDPNIRQVCLKIKKT